MTASVTQSARADLPVECTPAYLAIFDERLEDVPFDCVERLRVAVPVRSSDRVIRIIHDSSVDWAAGEADLARIDRGVRAAADAIPALGDVDLMNTTILLADDFPPPEGDTRFSDIAAQTRPGDPEECHIIVYLVGADPAYIASDVAHEIFHCIQDANLSDLQMSSGSVGTGGGGDWWLEGSADWFAMLALPERGRLDSRIAAFDEYSPTQPLNEMAYASVVFFLWLGGDASPPAVMTLLSGMAESADVPAQRRAMASALPQERWLSFAQAYLDRRISDPRGVPIGVNPAEGEIWEWSATQTRTASLTPFVLHRGVVSFECGRWRTNVSPGAMHRARPEDGGEWAPLPGSIDTTSGSGGAYRFAAINARAADVTLGVAGTMEAGCGDCLGSREIAACVVGTWQLTGGGPAEWMRAQGMPGNFSTSNQSVIYRRDGTFITSAMHGTADVTVRDRRETGNMSAQAGGRWSTMAGNLNVCADMQAFSSSRHGGPTGPGNLQMSYSCAGGTLTTVQPMPRGAPPMTSTYSRVAE